MKVIAEKSKRISEKTGQRFSQNDYLKLLIRQDSEIDLINYKKSEFDLALDTLVVKINQNNEYVRELTEVYERLTNLLIAGQGGLLDGRINESESIGTI